MKTNQEVNLLFDAKAHSWNAKYEANGPLAYRVTAFSVLLESHLGNGAAVLDFGGGTGAIASALARRGFRMTVCDLSEQMITMGRQIHSGQAIEWSLLPENWKRLPFADGVFDAVVASSVFEYLNDADSVLAECRRILRPAGKLIFSVPNPNHGSRRLERFLRPPAVLASKIPLVGALPKIGNYLRYLRVSSARFTAAQWQQKASSAGFHAVEIEPGGPDLSSNKAMMYLLCD